MENKPEYRGRPRTFLKPDDEKVRNKTNYHSEWIKQNKQSAQCEHCGALINNKYNMKQHINSRYCTEIRRIMEVKRACGSDEECCSRSEGLGSKA